MAKIGVLTFLRLELINPRGRLGLHCNFFFSHERTLVFPYRTLDFEQS